MSDTGFRTRRPPPPFRTVEVVSSTPRTPLLQRVVVGGDSLDGFVISEPASSLRVVVPWPDEPFSVPTWTGNEFLLDDGRRPALRTFTPVQFDPEANELTLDVVNHAHGTISQWAQRAQPGDRCAVSGPGKGEEIDQSASRYVLLGDETALPAIEQLLAAIPKTIEVEAQLEITTPAAQLNLPTGSNTSITWRVADRDTPPGSTLIDTIKTTDLDEHSRVWAAGEAASVQAIRKHLFNERGVPRAHTTIRGYWKVPRSAD